MLTVIHGDDISASRKYFIDLRQKTPGAVSIEGQNLALTDLVQILEGGNLFNDEKSIFIEQLLLKKKQAADFKEIISYLNQQNSSSIVIWEPKELEKSSLNLFKNARIQPFKLPQSLFMFLDSLKPGSAKTTLPLFHKTLENSETEAIFYMLIRQIRILLAIHPEAQKKLETRNSKPETNSNDKNLNIQNISIFELRNSDFSPIDEVKRLGDWQKSKLEKQAKSFSLDQLLILYSELFKIESAQKTGTLSQPLTSSIDMLLLEI